MSLLPHPAGPQTINKLLGWPAPANPPSSNKLSSMCSCEPELSSVSAAISPRLASLYLFMLMKNVSFSCYVLRRSANIYLEYGIMFRYCLHKESRSMEPRLSSKENRFQNLIFIHSINMKGTINNDKKLSQKFNSLKVIQ